MGKSFSKIVLGIGLLILLTRGVALGADEKKQTSGNPLFHGWYADPEGLIANNEYWIFPTYSAKYEEQVYFDAFSSPDLVHWTKHPKVLTKESISWAHKAMWAPAMCAKDGKYYFVFAANDIHKDHEPGGLGIAVADKPEGPYKDYLGKPLINEFHNGAQPIDPYVFHDKDDSYYLIYGGWGHCNIAKLNKDFTGFEPLKDGSLFKEITPKNYVEGPLMFERNGKYYFMWSEGGWTGPNYCVAYAMADNPQGPFERIGKILKQDPKVARGAGHHGLFKLPGKDEYYIIYHRRPLTETDGNHRETCIDKMEFDEAGKIKPVTITFEGVEARPLVAK